MTTSALAFRTVDTSACGRASATMQSDAATQHRGPEREIADGTEPFAHGQRASRPQSLQIAAAADEPPDPDREQDRWNDQQPQVQRLGKPERLE